MEVTLGKITSLVIGLGYAAFAVWHSGIAGLKWSATLLLPLALIWFSEEIGGLTGYYKTGYVNTQTPPVINLDPGLVVAGGSPAAAFGCQTCQMNMPNLSRESSAAAPSVFRGRWSFVAPRFRRRAASDGFGSVPR